MSNQRENQSDSKETLIMLQEDESYRLLSSYKIAVPRHQKIVTEDEAIQAADTIGYPVVVKVVSDSVIHKSDVGGVITDCRDALDVKKAISLISSSVRMHNPDARIDGYLIAQHLPEGLELLIGGKTDPTFGKLITFGLGGIFVELISDISLRILPVDRQELVLMIQEISGYRLLGGYRGIPPYDEKFLVTSLEKICNLFLACNEIMEFDINPFRLYQNGGCVIDARFFRGTPSFHADTTIRQPVPTALLHPSSIAVVGASHHPEKVGYTLMRNMLAFSGEVFPVNPSGGELFGRTVFTSLTTIPGHVDMVMVAVPSSAVVSVVTDAAVIKASVVVILSAGFSEMGPTGEERENEICAIAKKAGIRLVGPNCLGIIIPSDNLNATFTNVVPTQGQIGFISQSGAVITSVTDWSLTAGIGFSLIISVGNQADLDIVDYIRLLGDDPKTSVIILYIEQIHDGKAFMQAAADIGSHTPIIALKSGSSEYGRQAARSHTGSLTGSYKTYIAAFKQCGVIPVYGIKEAFATGSLLAIEGYPLGNRAVVITNAGGLGVLASDYAEQYGVSFISLSQSLLADLNAVLPQEWSHNNPVDIIGDADIVRFSHVFDVFIRHKSEWDIAFIIISPVARIDPVSLAHELIRFSSHVESIIIGCMLGGISVEGGISILQKGHIACFTDLKEAFLAVGTVIRAKERMSENLIESDYKPDMVV